MMRLFAPTYVAVIPAIIGASGVALMHCSSSSTTSNGGGGTQLTAPFLPAAPPGNLGVPPLHRANSLMCTVPRTPATDGGSAPNNYGGCTGDGQCTSGQDGRCQAVYNSMACGCSYDTCDIDDVCGDNAVCLCRTTDTPSSANHCLTAGNCRVDSECGAGGYCSPSLLVGDTCNQDNIAYFCHSAQDQCVQDSQCVAAIGQPAQGCLFSPHGEGYWACFPFSGCDSGVGASCGAH